MDSSGIENSDPSDGPILSLLRDRSSQIRRLPLLDLELIISVMQPEGVNCIPVIVDLVSLGLLKGMHRLPLNDNETEYPGATLHHATELIGSSFRLQDNPQAKEGGNCGCGVSWELK